MKIAFVHDWEVDYYQEVTWQDGLAAALKYLRDEKGHEIKLFICGKEHNMVKNPYHDIYVTPDMVDSVKEFNPDVILHWADMTRPNAQPLVSLGKPQAICFAGGEVNSYNTDLFDHIFVESQVYADRLGGRSVSIAFGTNTDLFIPVQQTPTFDTIFPATFALWKRHDLYAKATEGLRSLAVGFMYDSHETECWQECLNHDITILPHVSAKTLKYLYASSKVCVIPSRPDGGSQRTVLEAMAMNMPLIVCDSDKFDYLDGVDHWKVAPTVNSIKSALRQALITKVNTREVVLEKWSHIKYAEALEEGLLKLV